MRLNQLVLFVRTCTWCGSLGLTITGLLLYCDLLSEQVFPLCEECSKLDLFTYAANGLKLLFQYFFNVQYIELVIIGSDSVKESIIIFSVSKIMFSDVILITICCNCVLASRLPRQS